MESSLLLSHFFVGGFLCALRLVLHFWGTSWINERVLRRRGCVHSCIKRIGNIRSRLGCLQPSFISMRRPNCARWFTLTQPSNVGLWLCIACHVVSKPYLRICVSLLCQTVMVIRFYSQTARLGCVACLIIDRVTYVKSPNDGAWRAFSRFLEVDK